MTFGEPIVEAAYKSGGVKSFARHSRLGGTDIDSTDGVETAFKDSVAYLRKLGYKRISLKPLNEFPIGSAARRSTERARIVPVSESRSSSTKVASPMELKKT